MVSESLLVGLLASATGVLGARSAGCDKAATVSSRDYSVKIAGQNRQYRVQLPQNYNPATAYKLIFTWHQLGGSMQKIVQGENVNAGGVAETVDDSVGQLAARAEADDYAQAVEALFQRDIEAIGRAAREKAVNQFAWNRVFADLCRLYGGLTGDAAFEQVDPAFAVH